MGLAIWCLWALAPEIRIAVTDPGIDVFFWERVRKNKANEGKEWLAIFKSRILFISMLESLRLDLWKWMRQKSNSQSSQKTLDFGTIGGVGALHLSVILTSRLSSPPFKGSIILFPPDCSGILLRSPHKVRPRELPNQKFFEMMFLCI